MYTKQFTIQSIDVDSNARLKLSALFRYIQIIAGDAIDHAQIGQIDMNKEGLLWVLTRIAVKVSRWPKWQEKVYFSTYPNPNKKFIYPRHFIMHDENNNEIIRIVSSWALINASDRKITMIDLSKYEKFKTEEYESDLPIPSKMMANGEVEYLYSHTVRFTDCDINQHLNNTRYIDMILDCFDSSFYKEREIEYFQIQYESEVREKETINLYKQGDMLIGKVADRTSFVSLLKTKENIHG